MEENATEAEVPDEDEPDTWLDKLTTNISHGPKSALDRLRQRFRPTSDDQD